MLEIGMKYYQDIYGPLWFIRINLLYLASCVARDAVKRILKDLDIHSPTLSDMGIRKLNKFKRKAIRR